MKEPVIDTCDLSKSYGKERGIEKVNLTVNEGEIFGFIGPNGAGKSTTIRILLNLIFPSSGNARIMGMDVIRDSKKIKEITGYVPSDATAYTSMTTREFLEYCQHFYRGSYSPARLDELAEIFELDMHRRIADLSLGNRKKVAIIQSLVHNPRLLILDEPTTGLDPLMQNRFFELIRRENRNGMTIFYSSHILSEIQSLCKRVAIIREGKIIKTEEIEVLRKKQLKRVTIAFNNPADRELFTAPGIETSERPSSGNSISVVYSGNINDLIRAASGFNISDMTIEEPSLEEIFMHYYK